MKAVTHILNVFGPSETDINNSLKELLGENGVAIEVSSEKDISIKITSAAKTVEEAEDACSKVMLRIKQLLGDVVYASDSKGLEYEAVDALRQHKLKIATAESCTGGMLSQFLTSVPNSSEVVEIGITAYSDRIKHEALSVPENVLNEFGAISPQTAMYLAKNVRALGDAAIGIGITGNAGPSASENKPVGLVFVAIADRTKYFIKKLELPAEYGREKIRSYATMTALDLIRKYTAAIPFTMQGMVDFNQEFTIEEEDKETLDNKPAATDGSATAFDPNVNFVIFETDNDEDLTEDSSLENAKKSGSFAPSVLTALRNFAEKVKNGILSALPNKCDGLRDIIIKTASIVSAIALIVSSAVIISHFTGESKQRNIIETARENFDFTSEEMTEDNTYSAFDPLIEQNPDVKAWISISNTNVNNPVYQTTDNDFYLNHNMLKEKSRYGALFFDYRDTVSADTTSQNLTVYGHNMRDKSMFGSLSSYRDPKFYKSNPTISLKTLYSEETYIIFAIMITNASSKDDNGYLYNYTSPTFKTQDDFLSWIDEAKERSLITTDIEIEKHDQILTLSTCCYDFDDARFVIMAKRLADGEEIPDISSAKLNPNVRYPQAWYDKRGLEGYVKSETQDTTEDEETDASNEASSEETETEPSSSEVSSPSSSTPVSTPSPSTSAPSSSQESSSQVPSESTPSSSDEGSTEDSSGETNTDEQESSNEDNSEQKSSENSSPEETPTE